MKTRTRRRKKGDHLRKSADKMGPMPSGAASSWGNSGAGVPTPAEIRFIDVPTAELLVLEDAEEWTPEEVRDRFVKVAPRIAVSEREAFDGPAIAARIRAAGARAVVLAPVMVPEVRRVAPEKVAGRTPREAVAAWFDEQKTIPVDDRAAALELVLGFMDEESM